MDSVNFERTTKNHHALCANEHFGGIPPERFLYFYLINIQKYGFRSLPNRSGRVFDARLTAVNEMDIATKTNARNAQIYS
jgi:hypothetical protein